ncbi:acyltransferase domain-containing protein [Streptomyces sp. NPDC058653]|uniref:acyltransferase domain-containing protein n=1 Tax=Streptomyces sp. NPDC058653 TaxID=3346576 RepID=UPI00364C1BBC
MRSTVEVGTDGGGGGGGGPDAVPRTVLLLPGQGAQRERMAAGLHGRIPEFTEAADEFLGLLGAEGERLREVWLRPGTGPALDGAATAQPLLFAVGYALGRAVAARVPGAPAVLLGHSVGELAAACLAGVLPLTGAARLMAARGRALRTAPPGGMLAVAASVAGVGPFLGGGVTVGAVNGPRQTVLCGPREPLARAAERAGAAGLTVRPLRSDVGFHGPSLAGAAHALRAALDPERARWRAPRLPVYSSRTARPVTPAEAVRPDFWCDQVALPVLYWPALRALLAAEAAAPERKLLLLDASPDRSLGAPARRHPAVRAGRAAVVGLLPPRTAGTDEDPRVFETAMENLTAARAGVPSRGRGVVRGARYGPV